jgi:hypothetical protein
MTMPNRFLALALTAFAALAGAGCGSSSPGTSNPPPTSSGQLVYSDPPASSTGWRLVKNSTSTPTRLVLDLVGPGDKSRGVGFNLKADPRVRFLPLDDGMPVHDTGVFELRSVLPDTDVPAALGEPVYFAGGVMPGNVLTVGIFQKDRHLAAKSTNVPVLSIALDISKGGSAGPVALQVVKARSMPEDVGGAVDGPFDPQAILPTAVLAKSQLQPIEIAVGNLQVH